MYYTVMSGDTMYKIAAQFGTSLDDLLELNPDIADPNLIYPGQVMEIPAAGGFGMGFPIPGMPPGQPPAAAPPGFPEMPPGSPGMLPSLSEVPPGFPGIPPGAGFGGQPSMPEFLEFSGYPFGGIMPGIPGEMEPGIPFTLKIGDKGNEVKQLQKRLKELGYYTGSLSGRFGSKTKQAVKLFQKDCKVAANGIADSFLLQVLR